MGRELRGHPSSRVYQAPHPCLGTLRLLPVTVAPLSSPGCQASMTYSMLEVRYIRQQCYIMLRRKVRSQMSLREADHMVLRVLMAAASYGYAIRRDIKDATNGAVHPSLAVVYDALHRLLEDGMIRRGSDAVVDGRSRRTYEITGVGKRALSERDRLDAQLRSFGTVAAQEGAGGTQ